jgi:hypothetical protein
MTIRKYNVMTDDYDLYVYQGAGCSYSIVYKDSDGIIQDLTGFDAYLQVRDREGSEVLLEITSKTTGITINEALGEIILDFHPATTGALNFYKARYDLFLEDTNVTGYYCILKGNFIVVHGITA